MSMETNKWRRYLMMNAEKGTIEGASARGQLKVRMRMFLIRLFDTQFFLLSFLFTNRGPAHVDN